ncbi:MAG: hypothetical protein ACREE5_01225 [Acetobacteraceae bacterium]
MGLTVSLHETLWIVGRFLVCNGIEGDLVAPFVQRRTVHMPPALTLLAMAVLPALGGNPRSAHRHTSDRRPHGRDLPGLDPMSAE